MLEYIRKVKFGNIDPFPYSQYRNNRRHSLNKLLKEILKRNIWTCFFIFSIAIWDKKYTLRLEKISKFFQSNLRNKIKRRKINYIFIRFENDKIVGGWEMGVSNWKWWPRKKGGSVAGVARASADQYFILASPTGGAGS